MTLNFPTQFNTETWNYYHELSFLFEAKKFLFNREFAVCLHKKVSGKSTIFCRNMRAHNAQSIAYLYKTKARFLKDERLNMYYSLATYKDGVPRKEIGQPFDITWKERAWNDIISFDMLIDIDAPTHKEFNEAKKQAISLMFLLDEFNVAYHLRFSGCGFHFIIPGSALPQKSFNPYDDNSIYKFILDLEKKLEYRYEYIDTNLNDSRRITKLPYSVAHYGDALFICLPIMERETLINCKLEDFYLSKWKDEILRRGDYLFNPENLNNSTPIILMDEALKKNGKKKTN